MNLKEGRKKGGKEEGREGRREGGKEEGREGRKKGGREGDRERGEMLIHSNCNCVGGITQNH